MRYWKMHHPEKGGQPYTARERLLEFDRILVVAFTISAVLWVIVGSIWVATRMVRSLPLSPSQHDVEFVAITSAVYVGSMVLSEWAHQRRESESEVEMLLRRIRVLEKAAGVEFPGQKF